MFKVPPLRSGCLARPLIQNSQSAFRKAGTRDDPSASLRALHFGFASFRLTRFARLGSEPGFAPAEPQSRHPGSNRGPTVYKTVALPLSYTGKITDNKQLA